MALAARLPDRPSRTGVIGLLVLGTAAAFVVFWFIARGSTPYDFQTYRNAGHAVLNGRSPYVHLPLRSIGHGDDPFVYPLPAAWVYAPFALLPFHVASWLYAGLSIGAFMVGMWWIGVRSPLVFALVIGSSLVVRGLGLGTIDSLLFLGICGLVRFRDRPRVAALIYVGLIALKPLMLPLIVYVLVTGRRAAAVVAAIGTAILLAVSVAGGFSPRAYARLLSELSQREASASGSGIRQIMRISGWSLGSTTLLVTVIGAAVLAVTLVAGLRGRLDHRAVLAISIGVALAASPIVWSHYLAFLLVPLLMLRRQLLVAAVTFALSWLILPHSFPPRLTVPRVVGPADQRLLMALVPLAVIAIVLTATRRSPRSEAERTAALP
jgi:hypothetical protein